MLECMLAGGGDAKLVTWSGPGNKKLIAGNKEAGYFGTVTVGELFSFNEINALVTSTTKQSNSLAYWHKFIINNSRVFYIPNTWALGKIGWKDIYNSGLIYGKRGAGRTPLPAGMTAVEQFNPIIKGENVQGKVTYWPLVVRTPNGTNVDPYARMADLSDELKTYKNIVDGTWATNVPPTAMSLMSERDGQGVTSYRRNLSTLNTPTGTFAVDSIGSESFAASSAQSYAWTPIVELVRDPNVALDPYMPGFGVTGASIVTPVLSVEFTGTAVTGPVNIIGTIGKPMKPFNLATEGLNPIVAGEAIGASQSLTVSIMTDGLVTPISNVALSSSTQLNPPLAAQVVNPFVYGDNPNVDTQMVISGLAQNLVTAVSTVSMTSSQQPVPNLTLTTLVD